MSGNRDADVEISDADWDSAERISAAWEATGKGLACLDRLIAQALAEERKKARAPFLAVIDDYEVGQVVPLHRLQLAAEEWTA